ncbi:hypothetical protein QCD85_23695, partial [Paenibacillus sp. PsM32]|uniref:hypothetical protein n=1 Tax=Paenibacillus sp. PsM32 TaxID=3030536 RepID=UPI00263B5751
LSTSPGGFVFYFLGGGGVSILVVGGGGDIKKHRKIFKIFLKIKNPALNNCNNYALFENFL